MIDIVLPSHIIQAPRPVTNQMLLEKTGAVGADDLELVQVGKKFLAYAISGFSRQKRVNSTATRILHTHYPQLKIRIFGNAVLFEEGDYDQSST